jgi:hypothetical protein
VAPVAGWADSVVENVSYTHLDRIPVAKKDCLDPAVGDQEGVGKGRLGGRVGGPAGQSLWEAGTEEVQGEGCPEVPHSLQTCTVPSPEHQHLEPKIRVVSSTKDRAAAITPLPRWSRVSTCWMACTVLAGAGLGGSLWFFWMGFVEVANPAACGASWTGISKHSISPKCIIQHTFVSSTPSFWPAGHAFFFSIMGVTQGLAH